MNVKIVEQADKVSTPTGGDGRSAEGVFQDQVPADDPGDELAQGGIAVGVRRTGDRYQGRELGIAQSCKCASDASDDETERDRRASEYGGGRSDEHKNAGPNNCADSKSDEVNRTKRPLQLVFAFLMRFLQKRGHGLDCPEFRHIERFLPVFSIKSEWTPVLPTVFA